VRHIHVNILIKQTTTQKEVVLMEKSYHEHTGYDKTDTILDILAFPVVPLSQTLKRIKCNE